MAIVRLLVIVLGVLCLLMGLLWIGQGMGVIRWPASSFMIDVHDWVMRGAILAILGAVMILIGRRLGRGR
jgi:hypothetical protein